MRPLCKAMITREYTYAYAAVSVTDGVLDTLILPTANTIGMQLFLTEVATRHPNDRIVMIADGAGWHQSTQLTLPNNLYLLKLPPYSPELNPVENLWDELREKSFGNLVFDWRRTKSYFRRQSGLDSKRRFPQKSASCPRSQQSSIRTGTIARNLRLEFFARCHRKKQGSRSGTT
jgi:transposase